MGLSFFFLPLNQIILSGVPSRDLASASGVSNFIRTMSGSISTAMTVWIWNRRTDYHHAVLAEHISNSAAGWDQYRRSSPRTESAATARINSWSNSSAARPRRLPSTTCFSPLGGRFSF